MLARNIPKCTFNLIFGSYFVATSRDRECACGVLTCWRVITARRHTHTHTHTHPHTPAPGWPALRAAVYILNVCCKPFTQLGLLKWSDSMRGRPWPGVCPKAYTRPSWLHLSLTHAHTHTRTHTHTHTARTHTQRRQSVSAPLSGSEEERCRCSSVVHPYIVVVFGLKWKNSN